MNIESLTKSCCGCGACASACPQGAILMRADTEGFLSPSVSNDLCVSCGKCVAVCQADAQASYSLNTVTDVYACQAKDTDVLIEATAGGLFPVLAEYVIEQGGIVYGAAYNDGMEVVHIGIEDQDGITKLNGSKYVQSNTAGVFHAVRDALLANRMVLFSGTPCQIAALRLFCAEVSTENLITVDVVCYGVPSPKLFRSYLDALEKRHRAKVTDFRFRDKHTYGWSHTTVIRMEKENREKIVIEQPDHTKIDYYQMFAHRDCFRKSCYSCKFNKMERCSDLTTGNFWGIEALSHAFESSLGVSMLLVNTKKGAQVFEKIKDRLYWEERTVEEAIQANDALVKGCIYPRDRDAIYHCFSKHGFARTVRKFYSKLSYRKIINFAYKIKKHILSSRKHES